MTAHTVALCTVITLVGFWTALAITKHIERRERKRRLAAACQYHLDRRIGWTPGGGL